MTFDSVFDGSSTSQASSTSLDLERIRHFAAMTLNELHENWNLSCTSTQFSRTQEGSKADTPVEPEDDTTVDDTQDLYSTKHIPTINNNASILTTDPISITTNLEIPSVTASPPRSAPTRIFRQRQPIQLQPFTEDRKQYHFLIGRKERLEYSGDKATTTATSSPLPQSLSESDPSFVDDIPSDDGYSGYDDSDGFVGDLGVDDGEDLSQATSMMDISTDNYDYNDIGTGYMDRDKINKANIRKKRRIVIVDDSDDGLDSDNSTTLTQNSPSRISNNNKKKIYDIFEIPSDGELEQPFARQHNSTSKGLITYGRKKKSTKHQKERRKSSTSQRFNINISINNSLPKRSPSPTRHSDYDIFDIESLNYRHDQQIDKMPKNILDDTLVTHDDTDDYGENSDHASTATLSTTPQPSTTPTQQIKHGPGRKKATRGTGNDDNNDDDDGFIVDDDDYGREKRRRNTTLHEIRKNKRYLKGILPTSFTTIYEKQLAEEENDKQRQPFIIPTKRKSGQDTEEHNKEDADAATAMTTTTTTTMGGANNAQSECWEIEETALGDEDTTTAIPSRHTSWSPWRSASRSSGHSHETMDSRRYEEEQRSWINENLPMDCGVPYLRCGAASVTKLTFMDDDKFSLFSLHQYHHSLPTVVLDQSLVDTDYVEDSPAISNLFELAYRTFDTMWTNFKFNDNDGPDKNTTTVGDDLYEKNMVLFLGFLRFVSILLSKGYQNKSRTDGNGGGGDEIDKVISAPEMQEYLIGKMNDLADRILTLVNWIDGGGVELAWLKNGNTNQGSSSPLLLALVYFVEWSYQIYKVSLVNPLNMIFTATSSDWTLKTSLNRLLRYLLSLGPSSVSIEPVTGLLFNVSEPRVMETWVMVLHLMKLEDMVDSALWPSLQDFMEQMDKSSLLENAGNIGDNDGTVWNKVEVTWKWVLTLASLQRIQKDNAGFGKVKTIDFNYNSGCWGVVQQLLREVLQQKTTIGNISMTDKVHFQQFRSLTFIRLTFCRCHYLLTNYNWMWDSKTLQHLYNLAHIPQLQVFTGDPIHPQQHLQQQDKVTAAKYFPSYFTNYTGAIPDDEIDSTDTCGIVFLKILSYGLQKRVDIVLKSSSNSWDDGAYNNEHRENLQTCLARVMPSYLVAGDLASSKSSSILLHSLVSNPASSFNQGKQINPLVTFSYDYSINMTILHATARLGRDNNIGLDVFRCKIEFHTRLETERACAIEITSEAHRIYENIKKKWGLN